MMQGKQEMDEMEILPQTAKNKIKSSQNFKAPGVDKVNNYWLKRFDKLHEHYTKCFNKLIKGQEEMPEWLTTGQTSLIPKSKETHLPSKYRPICCLPTTYKWMTGLIADAIYYHLCIKGLLEPEQKGCRKKTQGTKEQLLINKTIMEHAKKRNKNLSMAWIDYKKAYDSVPHSWIKKCMEIYKINKDLRTFLENQMEKWKTDISLEYENGQIEMKEVKIRRGIFQGDSLSPLLFCMAIDPLSKIIKENKIGYSLNKSRKKEEKELISHLLFMDDLKLYAENDTKLEEQIQCVQSFSNDIGMEFGLDKCSKCTIIKGKKVSSRNIEVADGKSIEDLGNDSTYKYLGIEENATIEHRAVRNKAKAEYITRTKKICRSMLTPKNKITAINQLALPVLTYGFGVVDWPQLELHNLDIKTRKILTMNKIIYRNQCMDRVYLPRRDGGLGLCGVDEAYRTTIIALAHYLETTTDEHLTKVKKYHSEDMPEGKSIIRLAKCYLQDVKRTEENTEPNQLPTQMPSTNDSTHHNQQNGEKNKENARDKYVKTERLRKLERWKNNQRAGRFHEEIRKNYIDQEGSMQWIRNGELGHDGERILMAAQDQGLMTNTFKKMCGLTNDDKCRMCHETAEGTAHILAGCKIMLADGRYTERHNKVCSYLHHTICQEYGLPVENKVWMHEPAPVTANDRVTIYYDKDVRPGRYIEGKGIKPDIVVWDKEEKSAQIIEISVPNDLGLNRAEREKVNKYQDLKNDLKQTWSLQQIEIIPVIIGATGLMKNNLQNYLDKIKGRPNKYQVQAAAIRGTVKIIKRFLGTEFQ